MRLIDADALVERLERHKKGTHPWYGTAIDTAQMMVEEATTVGGWISVKDRLPKSGENVLAWCEIHRLDGKPSGYVCKAFYSAKHSIQISAYEEIDGEYDEDEDMYYLPECWWEKVHNWEDYSYVVIEDFVTHWMPLPEPPKEQGTR